MSQNLRWRGWREGSLVKGACSYYKGLAFHSQHPCQGAHTTCSPSPSPLTPFSSLCGYLHITYIYTHSPLSSMPPCSSLSLTHTQFKKKKQKQKSAKKSGEKNCARHSILTSHLYQHTCTHMCTHPCGHLHTLHSSSGESPSWL